MRKYHELTAALLQAEATGLVMHCLYNETSSDRPRFDLFADHRSKPIEALSADCDRLPIDRNISTRK